MEKSNDNFLNRYPLPKLNEDQIHNLNWPTTPGEIEPVIKVFPTTTTKKSPGPYTFSVEIYQTFKEELMPIFFKLFHKTETERILSNSFYEAAVTLRPKPHKDSINQQRKVQTNFPYEHRRKNM